MPPSMSTLLALKPPLERIAHYNYLASLATSPQTHLTDTEAETHFHSQPPLAHTFFPRCPQTAARSLALTNHYFCTRPSQIIPCHLGLTLRRTVPPHRTQLFVGLYTGLTHDLDIEPPHGPPTHPSMYCLQLTPTDLVVNGCDIGASDHSRN